MYAEHCVVDNRVLLLGLDQLYREAMKEQEAGELLACADCVAMALGVEPAEVPIEGYYTETDQLSGYFRLVRALQGIDGSATPAVEQLSEFQRILEVLSSPLYGQPQFHGRLLPAGRDALSVALWETRPEWTITALTAAAHRAAVATDDISLVGLAARARDPVLLAATRESVVLYAELAVLGVVAEPQRECHWEVDDELAACANRFIGTFNDLFGDHLPPAESAMASRYWHASEDNGIVGRCACLGRDPTATPVRQYHWAVCRADDGEEKVEAFWSTEVWTTARYRASRVGGRCS